MTGTVTTAILTFFDPLLGSTLVQENSNISLLIPSFASHKWVVLNNGKIMRNEKDLECISSYAMA